MVQKLVESVNRLSPKEFFDRYLPPDIIDRILPDPDPDPLQLKIHLEGANSFTCIASKLLDKCLRLIEITSADDYRHSDIKWSLAKKKKEMNLPDMKYLILARDSSEATNGEREAAVVGFVSFMITYEDGHEVIYCYEIHLDEAYQGLGIGKRLMAVVEVIGKEVGVEKAMLTVFKANQRAVKMYQDLGYVEDEFSPGPRKLRNGTVKEPSYVILSKQLQSSRRRKRGEQAS